jgi:hypothetical protein
MLGRCGNNWRSMQQRHLCSSAIIGWMLGFGLENYDAIGKWRTMDGKFPVTSAARFRTASRFHSCRNEGL